MYVYVASSWRNPSQPAVIAALRAAGIDCYDFRNPPGGTGFSWSEVKTPDGPASDARCQHCGRSIRPGLPSPASAGGNRTTTPTGDPVIWRHLHDGYAACMTINAVRVVGTTYAIPKKGSDWETAEEYLRMMEHPRSLAGFASDFDAMKAADAIVMILPCGKSAHLELGWGAGAGKRTAVLLEDPVEPELMYHCADYLARNVDELVEWLRAGDR